MLSSADACAGDRERAEEREARWSRLEGSAGRERMAEKQREKRVGGGGEERLGSVIGEGGEERLGSCVGSCIEIDMC